MSRSSSPPRQSASAALVAAGLLACGAGLGLSAAVDVATGGSDGPELAAVGGASLAVAIVLRRTFTLPVRIPASTALRAVGMVGGSMIAVSTIAFLATGTGDGIAGAAFESTAGFTTTALTGLDDVEANGRGVLLWRALTQWIGGFAALWAIVAVLPFLGVGGPLPSGGRPPVGASRLRSRHVRRAVRDYGAIYLGLTCVGGLLLSVGGMGAFDATTYALTTISTGGFANHDASFAHFDSAVLEWFGIAGMMLGGLSLALVWRVLRRRGGSLLRSAELAAYLSLIAGGTVVVALTSGHDAGAHDTWRAAAFSVTSVVSTTGHWSVDWTVWDPGAQMLLVVLMGIGAMSGSIGGGFRIVRAQALVGYVWRQLGRQLRPREVQVVRVGDVSVDEDLLERMIGYQVLFLGTAAVGLFALALTGADLVTSLSGTVSALATVGPALGDLAPGSSLAGADVATLAVLGVLMFSGRVELYPVLDAVAGAALKPGRLARWLLRQREAGRR